MTGAAGKRIFVIGGPNGAGKTTFATEFLPNEADCPIFVNADLIAAGLSPFGPARVAVEAGRLVLRQIEAHARQGHSFAFETTLSGRGHARRIARWRQGGYRVKLFFLRLPTPEAAIARVAQRVSEGGHDVSEAVIRRRFHAGWRNFEETYRGLVDGWAIYDNSDDVPILLEVTDSQVSTHRGSSSLAERDPDMVGAEVAMHRAARRARERAKQAARSAARARWTARVDSLRRSIRSLQSSLRGA